MAYMGEIRIGKDYQASLPPFLGSYHNNYLDHLNFATAFDDTNTCSTTYYTDISPNGYGGVCHTPYSMNALENKNHNCSNTSPLNDKLGLLSSSYLPPPPPPNGVKCFKQHPQPPFSKILRDSEYFKPINDMIACYSIITTSSSEDPSRIYNYPTSSNSNNSISSSSFQDLKISSSSQTYPLYSNSNSTNSPPKTELFENISFKNSPLPITTTTKMAAASAIVTTIGSIGDDNVLNSSCRSVDEDTDHFLMTIKDDISSALALDQDTSFLSGRRNHQLISPLTKLGVSPSSSSLTQKTTPPTVFPSITCSSSIDTKMAAILTSPNAIVGHHNTLEERVGVLLDSDPDGSKLLLHESLNSPPMPDITSEHRADMVWNPNSITDDNLLKYLRSARSITAQASGGILNIQNSSPKNGVSKESSAAGEGNTGTTHAVSRDGTTQRYFDLLHENDYHIAQTLDSLEHEPLPKMWEKEWTHEDAKCFSRAIKNVGKDFYRVRSEYLSHKTTKELVQFYYFWKKSSYNPSRNNQRRINRKSRTSATARLPPVTHPFINFTSNYLKYSGLSITNNNCNGNSNVSSAVKGGSSVLVVVKAALPPKRFSTKSQMPIQSSPPPPPTAFTNASSFPENLLTTATTTTTTTAKIIGTETDDLGEGSVDPNKSAGLGDISFDNDDVPLLNFVKAVKNQQNKNFNNNQHQEDKGKGRFSSNNKNNVYYKNTNSINIDNTTLPPDDIEDEKEDEDIDGEINTDESQRDKEASPSSTSSTSSSNGLLLLPENCNDAGEDVTVPGVQNIDTIMKIIDDDLNNNVVTSSSSNTICISNGNGNNTNLRISLEPKNTTLTSSSSTLTFLPPDITLNRGFAGGIGETVPPHNNPFSIEERGCGHRLSPSITTKLLTVSNTHLPGNENTPESFSSHCSTPLTTPNSLKNVLVEVSNSVPKISSTDNNNVYNFAEEQQSAVTAAEYLVDKRRSCLAPFRPQSHPLKEPADKPESPDLKNVTTTHSSSTYTIHHHTTTSSTRSAPKESKTPHIGFNTTQTTTTLEESNTGADDSSSVILGNETSQINLNLSQLPTTSQTNSSKLDLGDKDIMVTTIVEALTPLIDKEPEPITVPVLDQDEPNAPASTSSTTVTSKVYANGRFYRQYPKNCENGTNCARCDLAFLLNSQNFQKLADLEEKEKRGKQHSATSSFVTSSQSSPYPNHHHHLTSSKNDDPTPRNTSFLQLPAVQYSQTVGNHNSKPPTFSNSKHKISTVLVTVPITIAAHLPEISHPAPITAVQKRMALPPTMTTNNNHPLPKQSQMNLSSKFKSSEEKECYHPLFLPDDFLNINHPNNQLMFGGGAVNGGGIPLEFFLNSSLHHPPSLNNPINPFAPQPQRRRPVNNPNPHPPPSSLMMMDEYYMAAAAAAAQSYMAACLNSGGSGGILGLTGAPSPPPTQFPPPFLPPYFLPPPLPFDPSSGTGTNVKGGLPSPLGSGEFNSTYPPFHHPAAAAFASAFEQYSSFNNNNNDFLPPPPHGKHPYATGGNNCNSMMASSNHNYQQEPHPTPSSKSRSNKSKQVDGGGGSGRIDKGLPKSSCWATTPLPNNHPPSCSITAMTPLNNNGCNKTSHPSTQGGVVKNVKLGNNRGSNDDSPPKKPPYLNNNNYSFDNNNSWPLPLYYYPMSHIFPYDNNGLLPDDFLAGYDINHKAIITKDGIGGKSNKNAFNKNLRHSSPIPSYPDPPMLLLPPSTLNNPHPSLISTTTHSSTTKHHQHPRSESVIIKAKQQISHPPITENYTAPATAGAAGRTNNAAGTRPGLLKNPPDLLNSCGGGTDLGFSFKDYQNYKKYGPSFPPSAANTICCSASSSTSYNYQHNQTLPLCSSMVKTTTESSKQSLKRASDGKISSVAPKKRNSGFWFDSTSGGTSDNNNLGKNGSRVKAPPTSSTTLSSEINYGDFFPGSGDPHHQSYHQFLSQQFHNPFLSAVPSSDMMGGALSFPYPIPPFPMDPSLFLAPNNNFTPSLETNREEKVSRSLITTTVSSSTTTHNAILECHKDRLQIQNRESNYISPEKMLFNNNNNFHIPTGSGLLPPVPPSFMLPQQHLAAYQQFMDSPSRSIFQDKNATISSTGTPLPHPSQPKLPFLPFGGFNGQTPGNFGPPPPPSPYDHPFNNHFYPFYHN